MHMLPRCILNILWHVQQIRNDELLPFDEFVLIKFLPFQVQPTYEPAVVERYRFEARVHGLERAEAAASKSAALVQQYQASLTTETTQTLTSKTEIEWHIMREDSVVESATATESTHQDLEVRISSSS